MPRAAPILFHDSWQSSAAWRVRAALALKGIGHVVRMHEVIGKPHRTPGFVALNPQGTVPVLEVDGHVIPQSLAILEYLEETRSDPPLLPGEPAARARVRVLAQIIALETHIVTNMDVALHASGGDRDALSKWIAHYVRRGFDAFEAHLDNPATGDFCHGDTPGLAECCLVPQARNAERAGIDLAAWPRLAAIHARALALPAFIATHPDRVAPKGDPT